MILNDKKNSKITDFNNYYVVTDYDRTLTKGNSITSWGVFAESDLLPDDYENKRKELENYYAPIESDINMDYTKRSVLVKEWYYKHAKLLVSYDLKEKDIKDAVSKPNIMNLRNGIKEIFTYLNNKNVPIIIISAGIGNNVKEFLSINGCLLPNVYIYSNFLEFKNDKVSFSGDNIIHSLNKNEVLNNKEINNITKNRNKVLLLGDQLGDIKMAPIDKEIYSLGFLLNKEHEDEYNEVFDILCDDNTTFNEVGNLLFEDYN